MYETGALLQVEDLIINEINYKSSETFNPDDWIELYNPKSTSVDISNWEIRDDDDTHVFVIPQGTEIEGNGYLVFVKDASDFTSVFPDTPYVGELGFGLGTSDEVRLYNTEQKLVDEVSYASEAPWPSCANETGNTLELISPDLDNSLAENWNCINENGSPYAVNSNELLAEVIDLELITIYPNPVNNILYVNGGLSFYDIEVYSLLGQRVITVFNVNQIDVNSLNEGVYLVKISAGNMTTTKRIIKF